MIAIQPTTLDAKVLKVVNEYLDGVSVVALAEKYDLTQEEILSYLHSKPVEKYINTTLANYGYLNPKERINLLNKIIDQKLQLAEENDLPISKKDIVEVIKLLQDEQKLNKIAPDEQSLNINYLNLVNQIKD